MSDSESTALDIIDRSLGDVLSERYLAYALSTIMARSLPDVRDGLKPVHRRLLYAMRQLQLGPETTPKKSARVVGDVIGKYHPHGDQAVYDALVRLAQDFAARYPLVDGQGNFGNIDGDNAAAMRYTEARLTSVAQALLDGIDDDTVDFRDTYDGEGQEPVVLPARFPNLLANGSQGIAVGMACSIPPHNAAEICDALITLIDAPEAPVEKLVSFIKGPDLPTGGILVEETSAIIEAYRTGRGGFRVRARWHREEMGQGTYQIVVTEIPYQVQKSKLVERIAELLNQRKVPLLDDVRDESAEDVRLVLVPKSRNVSADVLMEQLFKHSDLETRISLNMNVLDQGRVPRVMSLPEVLQAFLDHRQEVLVRRSRHRLGVIERRLEVLAGYLIAYLNLDAVIQVIREADKPKDELIRRFDLTETQAEAILNMRLRALNKLQEIEIRREEQDLTAEKTDLEGLLADPARQWAAIRDEIGFLKAQFGRDDALCRRRTGIGTAPSDVVVPVDAMIEREPVTVLLSQKGWIRMVKGHQAGETFRYKEGDSELFALNTETTDKVILFASNGRAYTLPVDKLPGGRGFGEPLRLSIDLENDADVLMILPHRKGEQVLVASTLGYGFVVGVDDVVGQTRTGKQILNLGGEAKMKIVAPTAGGDHVATIGNNRKLLVFPLNDVPVMTRGKGVILQRFKDAQLSDLKIFALADGLSWPLGETRTRTVSDLTGWIGKRAGTGKLPPNGFPRNNRFS